MTADDLFNHTVPVREPPDPPDHVLMDGEISPRSYREVTVPRPPVEEERVPRDLQVLGLMRVQLIDDNRLKPQFSFAPQLVEELQKPWKDALIVKLLGRNVGFISLNEKARLLWKPNGEMTITDLGHGFHMVQFDDREDREYVMKNGPWMIQGHYLTVRTWSPEFIASDATVNSTMVWVRFPSLPMYYYNEDILLSIGNYIGKVIRVDKNTLTAARGRFARVCVEVDLTAPLVAQFWIDDEMYKVEFEGLHIACTRCGCYRHAKDSCINLVSAIPLIAVTMPGDVSMADQRSSEETVPGADPIDKLELTIEIINPEYGPWMIVVKRKYSPRRKNVQVIEPPRYSNAFDARTSSNLNMHNSGMSKSWVPGHLNKENAIGEVQFSYVRGKRGRSC